MTSGLSAGARGTGPRPENIRMIELFLILYKYIVVHGWFYVYFMYGRCLTQ